MKAQRATEKTFHELTADDYEALGHQLEWQGKHLTDCTKGELLKCVIYMTAQVAYLNNKLEKHELPFYKRTYWVNRFYWRGSSWQGILNTFLAFLFNRVLIRKIEQTDAGIKTVGWKLDPGTNYPRSKA